MKTIEFTEAEKALLTENEFEPLELTEKQKAWQLKHEGNTDCFIYEKHWSEMEGCGCCSHGVRQTVMKFEDGSFLIDEEGSNWNPASVKGTVLSEVLEGI